MMFRVVTLISARTEWSAAYERFHGVERRSSPLGDWFCVDLPVGEDTVPTVIFHGGWGKIAAAASTQYAIDRWKPDLLVNLGTCGGFEGHVEIGEVLLVERTLVYDIIEQMGDPVAAIARYTTGIDLSWLEEPLPIPVRRSLLISADRDLVAEEVPRLHRDFNAIAGDWESAAIAYVAARNNVRCLILRGVSDLVSASGGEAYDAPGLWARRTREIMNRLVETLPGWIAQGLEENSL
jgi:adenosylhomocysteine nucleosidase